MRSPRRAGPLPEAELLILGGGAAGHYCALSGAREGFRTVLVESAELGGTAFRWGCLPVKMALDRIKAHLGAGASPGGAGRASGPRASRRFRTPAGSPPRDLLRRVSGCLGEVEQRLQRQLEAQGVEVIFGEGAFTGPHTYRVGGRELRARHVVIATGTSPAGLPGLPLDGQIVISHRELFAGAAGFRRLLVLGGDVEGAEFAALFSSLGCRVTVVEQLPELLPGLDRDLAGPVETRLLESGVRLELGSPVAGVTRHRGGVTVELADGRLLEGQRVLVTGARRANIPAGLETTGARWDDTRIRVQDSLSTGVPGLYAIGDVNGLLGMAHAAIQQGTLLPRSLRSGRPLRAARWGAYRRPPRGFYTIPEIGGAGSTEGELQSAGTCYRSAVVALADTWRGLSKGVGGGFLKLLAEPGGKVLGIWLCGAEAAEASALFGFLIEAELGVERLAGSLVTHPTLAEALREAAWELLSS